MSSTSVTNAGFDVSNLRHFDREKLIYDSDLLPRERHILLAINSFVGADGQCFPKQSTIAEMTGYRREAVNRVVKDLEAQGLISIKHQYRPKGRGQTSNRYFVNWDAIAKRGRKTIESRGVSSAHTHGSDGSAHPRVPPAHTINYPIELSNDLTDQKITISDENAAPRDLGNFERGKAMKVAESVPDQPPYGSKPGSSSAAAPPKKKWNPECDQLSHDRHGWIRLPSTSSVVPEHRSAVSRAIAIAVRETQMWLIEQDIREVRVVEGEDGEDWVEYLDGSDLLDVALSKGGELPLQKLRSLAMSQGLITQSEFNSMLSTSFWESVNDLF